MRVLLLVAVVLVTVVKQSQPPSDKILVRVLVLVTGVKQSQLPV